MEEWMRNIINEAHGHMSPDEWGEFTQHLQTLANEFGQVPDYYALATVLENVQLLFLHYPATRRAVATMPLPAMSPIPLNPPQIVRKVSDVANNFRSLIEAEIAGSSEEEAPPSDGEERSKEKEEANGH